MAQTEKAVKSTISPKFWDHILRFELTTLSFVHSVHNGLVELYNDTLTSPVTWLFAPNHPNYARWLPVHIHDMMKLGKINSDIAV